MRYLAMALLALSACGTASEEAHLHKVVIVQRTTEAVPGPRYELQLEIDDITGGQVLTRLSQPDGPDVVPLRSMTVGDTAPFEFDGRGQRLGLSTMTNRLIGDDWAEFHVGDPVAVRDAQIAAILETIQTSRATFLVRGEPCDGATMAKHLRRAYAKVTDPVEDGRAFIERVVADGSYGVRALPDQTTPLPRWIRGRR
ncbi:MAG: hypothetical protein AAF628_17115 [Planctomycetota bacterium]